MKTNIRRFVNAVAISMPTGETLYLTPKQAKAIANALIATAADIGEVGFIASTLAPFEIDTAN